MDPLIGTSGTWWLVAPAGVTRVEENALLSRFLVRSQAVC